jgi:hypothetical protein
MLTRPLAKGRLQLVKHFENTQTFSQCLISSTGVLT